MNPIIKLPFYFLKTDYKTRNTGKIFEEFSADYLCSNNYKIIKRNFRTKHGELDCICLSPDRKCVAIIEVKARAIGGDFSARASVDYKKRLQVFKIAQDYYRLNKKNYADKNFRFDVIRISFQQDEISYKGTLEHIEKAIDHGFTFSFSNPKKIYRH